MDATPEIKAAQFLVDILTTHYPVARPNGWSFYHRWMIHSLGLSEREADIAVEALRGFTLKEIGATFHITRETVNKHLDNVYRKTGVRSKQALAAKILEGTGIT